MDLHLSLRGELRRMMHSRCFPFHALSSTRFLPRASFHISACQRREAMLVACFPPIVPPCTSAPHSHRHCILCRSPSSARKVYRNMLSPSSCLLLHTSRRSRPSRVEGREHSSNRHRTIVPTHSIPLLNLLICPSPAPRTQLTTTPETAECSLHSFQISAHMHMYRFPHSPPSSISHTHVPPVSPLHAHAVSPLYSYTSGPDPCTNPRLRIHQSDMNATDIECMYVRQSPLSHRLPRGRLHGSRSNLCTSIPPLSPLLVCCFGAELSAPLLDGCALSLSYAMKMSICDLCIPIPFRFPLMAMRLRLLHLLHLLRLLRLNLHLLFVLAMPSLTLKHTPAISACATRDRPRNVSPGPRSLSPLRPSEWILVNERASRHSRADIPVVQIRAESQRAVAFNERDSRQLASHLLYIMRLLQMRIEMCEHELSEREFRCST